MFIGTCPIWLRLTHLKHKELRVLRGPLAGLAQLVERNAVVSPALIVIGEVTAREDVAVAATAMEAAR